MRSLHTLQGNSKTDYGRKRDTQPEAGYKTHIPCTFGPVHSSQTKPYKTSKTKRRQFLTRLRETYGSEKNAVSPTQKACMDVKKPSENLDMDEVTLNAPAVPENIYPMPILTPIEGAEKNVAGVTIQTASMDVKVQSEMQDLDGLNVAAVSEPLYPMPILAPIEGTTFCPVAKTVDKEVACTKDPVCAPPAAPTQAPPTYDHPVKFPKAQQQQQHQQQQHGTVPSAIVIAPGGTKKMRGFKAAIPATLKRGAAVLKNVVKRPTPHTSEGESISALTAPLAKGV
ncbi:hypothetical protein WJX73_007584 [Symbiochloris irregularis]|uniref:Uncharacterized protein n=1 Tax=Symbiochloris irregularis TaxID=706552 RepID=A0AAW1PUP5_9CHLO